MAGGWYNNHPPPPEGQAPEDGAPSGGEGPLASLEPLRQNLPEVGGDGDQLN